MNRKPPRPVPMRSATTTAALAFLFASLALAGCGDDPEAAGTGPRQTFAVADGVTTVTLADPPGDVQVRKSHSDHPRPPIEQLDLRNVVLRRDRDSLRVVFTTAAPPGPGTIQRLIVYDDQLRRRSELQVEHPRDGGLRGTAATPGGLDQPVEASANGRVVTVEAPLDELTGGRRFKWRARTLSGSPVEVDDQAPSPPGQYRIFPR